MKQVFFLFAFFGTIGWLSAQDSLFMMPKEPEIAKTEIDLYEDTLVVLGNTMVNYPMQTKIVGADTIVLNADAAVRDSLNVYRFAACRQFIPTLVKALKTKNSFDHPFSNLKSVSIQYPEDRSFRIFTFQLKVSESEHRYYGAIQMNTPDLKLFPLIDRKADVDEPAYDVLDDKNWFGSYVYNLKQIGTAKNPKYLLFGFDGMDEHSNRKIIDVLTFEDGKPKFGAPVFTKEGDTRAASTVYRFILTYSDQGSITCNYDPDLDIVIYDHLQLVSNTADGRPVMISDGTYEGFEFKKGLLVYKEKLFDHKYEQGEPPMPKPVLGTKAKRDLFGN